MAGFRSIFLRFSITRRAYRDGQNDYLINGQRVRLREISELLAQSGLAERTYTIIGQGLVDAALALKPEERRRLFEEAAGIGLYRARREEALNHLGVTERNIERVKDILVELEPRLKSLEKQAHRAMEYEQIKADLRVLLRDWYGYHWHHSQEELTRAHEITKNQEARLFDVRKKYREINETVQSLRERIHAQRDQLNKWHSQSAECHNHLEKINRDLAVLSERQSAFLNQEKIAKEDLRRLEDESQELAQFLENAEQEKKDLEGDLEQAARNSIEARNKLQNQQNERVKLEKNLRENRQSLVSMETRKIQTKAHVDELANRLEQRKKEIEKTQFSIAANQDEFHESKVLLDTSTLEFSGLVAEIQVGENELIDIRREIKDLEKQQKDLNNEQMTLETRKIQGECSN